MDFKLRPFLGKYKRKLLGLLYKVIPKSLIKLFFELKKHTWVFIIGSTNSGSTLLQNILASHPEISGMRGEGQYRTRALRVDKDRLFGQRMELFELNENDDANHLRVYYDWYFETKGSRKILLEKTPVNSVRMRWLQKWFSPSKFIVIARSPYGVCEGMNRKTGVSLEAAAQNYNIVYQAILATLPHIKYSMVITYDLLTDSTSMAVEQIADFLGLQEGFSNQINGKWDIHEQKSEIKNMDFKSIVRLTKDELNMINRICSETMNKLGLRIVDDDQRLQIQKERNIVCT